MKTVAEFEFPYQAQIAQGRLSAEGIFSQVMNEVSSYVCLNTISRIKLVVNDEDYDKASIILSSSI